MKIEDILGIAGKGYDPEEPDIILRALQEDDDAGMDTLALFIAREISETVKDEPDDRKIDIAIHYMDKAAAQLQGVSMALYRAQMEQAQKVQGRPTECART